MSGGVYKGSAGDTNFRRTWNKDEYAMKGVQRSAGISNNTSLVEVADLNEKVEFSSFVNTSKTVVSVDESGFSCRICSLNFKDNLTYLDHLNSKEHQSEIGNQPVQRSTIKQVRDRLALGKKIKEKKLDPKERMMKSMEMAEREKMQLKEARKGAKLANRKINEVEIDNEVMAQMGFGNFGSSKK